MCCVYVSQGFHKVVFACIQIDTCGKGQIYILILLGNPGKHADDMMGRTKA